MAEFTLWVLKLSEKIEKEDHDQVANPTRGCMSCTERYSSRFKNNYFAEM